MHTQSPTRALFRCRTASLDHPPHLSSLHRGFHPTHDVASADLQFLACSNGSTDTETPTNGDLQLVHHLTADPPSLSPIGSPNSTTTYSPLFTPPAHNWSISIDRTDLCMTPASLESLHARGDTQDFAWLLASRHLDGIPDSTGQPPLALHAFHTPPSIAEFPAYPWTDGCLFDHIAGSDEQEGMLPVVNPFLFSPSITPVSLPCSSSSPQPPQPVVMTFRLSDNSLQRVDDPENDQIIRSFAELHVYDDDDESDSDSSTTAQSSSPISFESAPDPLQRCSPDEQVVDHDPPTTQARSSRSRAANAGRSSKTKPVKKSKMHNCPECGKQFPRPSGLATHLNSHSGEKRMDQYCFLFVSPRLTCRPTAFKCIYDGCAKTFAVRSNARRHLKTHGITPAACASPSLTSIFNIGFEEPVVNDVQHDMGRPPSRLKWIVQGAVQPAHGCSWPPSSRYAQPVELCIDEDEDEANRVSHISDEWKLQ